MPDHRLFAEFRPLHPRRYDARTLRERIEADYLATLARFDAFMDNNRTDTPNHGRSGR